MKKERIVYLDVLKVTAIFMVIFIHLVSPMWWHNDINSESFIWANLFEGISRWAVPIFVMCAGALILDPKIDLTPRKIVNKAGNLIIALIVFGLIYSISFDLIQGSKLSFTLFTDAIYNIYSAKAANHLWFIYMMIGLYLVTPILRTYVKAANKESLEYFILLWSIFSLIVPVLTGLGLNSIKPLITEMKLSLVLYYPGYFILGYYLKNYDLKPILKRTLYLLGIVALFVTVVGTYSEIAKHQHLRQIYFAYNTINVGLVAAALFVYAKGNLDFSGKPAVVFSELCKYTFGIFLVHGLFVYLLPKIYDFSFFYNHLYLTPLVAIIIYIPSLLIVYLLCKFKPFRKILM